MNFEVFECLFELLSIFIYLGNGYSMPESEPLKPFQDWWRKWGTKTKLTVILVTVFVIMGLCFLYYRFAWTHEEEHRWDMLVFAQSWPFTSCKAIVNSRSGCRLPSKTDFWTIHGIWPTKIGTYGPENCNSSNKLDLTEISPIQADLSEYWVNIKTNQKMDSFWNYEWKKHGTCALDLPALDTQSKYFNKALEWIKEYNMKGILEKAGLYPDSMRKLDLEMIWLAVKNELDKDPSIHCAYDQTIKQHYLQEIRICFDRNFYLTDCISSGSSKKMIGNCPSQKPIIYPSSVPSS